MYIYTRLYIHIWRNMFINVYLFEGTTKIQLIWWSEHALTLNKNEYVHVYIYIYMYICFAFTNKFHVYSGWLEDTTVMWALWWGENPFSKYEYVHIDVYIYIYIHIYIYICVCVCIYKHKHFQCIPVWRYHSNVSHLMRWIWGSYD